MPLHTDRKYLVFAAGAGDAGGFNPSSNATFYFANFYGADPNTTGASIGGVPWGFTMPFNGVINIADVQQYTGGTNGAAGENITYLLRKNDATDSGTIVAMDTNVDMRVQGTRTLGFPVSAGDEVVFKATTPAFTTPPTIMLFAGTFVLETTE